MATTTTPEATGLLSGYENLDPKFTKRLGEPLSGGAATKLGLGLAYSTIAGNQYTPYPNFTPSQTYGPSTNQKFYDYQANAPMGSVSRPDYTYNASVPTYQAGTYNYQNSARQAAPTVSNVGTAPTGNWNTVSAPTYEKAAAAPTWQNTSLGYMGVENPYSTGTVGNINSTYQNYGGANPTYQSYGGNTPTYQNYQGATPTYQKLDAAATPKFSAYSGDLGNAGTVSGDYQKFAGTTPTYEGLMGGDYEALQKALTTPGEIAAKNAYDEAMKSVRASMGASGLYGSSIMQQQAEQRAYRPYADALATNAANAAATRYAQQAADLQNKNAFGLDIYGRQMTENQALNDYAQKAALANQATGLSEWQTRVNENQGINELLNSVYGQQMAENQAANSQALQTWQEMMGQNAAANAQGVQTWEDLLAQNQAAQGQNLDVWKGLMSQNEAANAQNLDVAKTNQATQLAGAGLNLEAGKANQDAYAQLQALLSQQGLAQNEQAASNWANLLNYNQSQQGLMSSDYAQRLAQERAQNAQGLEAYNAQTGAQQNADELRTQQWQTGLSDLQNQDQANMAWQQFLASQNEAANQYGLDAASLQQAIDAARNANLTDWAQADIGQQQNLYNAGSQDAQRYQDYLAGKQADTRAQEQAYTDWLNQTLSEGFQYDVAKRADTQANVESLINQLLALAGKGAPLATAAAASKTASEAQSAADTSGLMSGLIGAAGNIGSAWALNQ